MPRLAMSKTDLALAIGVSTTSIDQMVAEQALPPPRVWHSRRLWLVAEVEGYLNEWPNDGDGRQRDRGPRREVTAQLNSRSEPVLGPKGYPIVDDPNDSLKQWYDKMGFDPRTMGEDEMKQLMKAAQERWLESIPGTPLNTREKKALSQLAKHGVGQAVSWTQVKHCGSDTQERLSARGFIQTISQEAFPGRIAKLVLTEEGLKAWAAEQTS